MAFNSKLKRAIPTPWSRRTTIKFCGFGSNRSLFYHVNVLGVVAIFTTQFLSWCMQWPQKKKRTITRFVGESNSASSSHGSTTSTALLDVDMLREELSCAICLDICFEPSTTPCGHSFCYKCLKSAADKRRRCPNCRTKISSGKYIRVNTVLWNTIQILFPAEVEAKKGSQ